MKAERVLLSTDAQGNLTGLPKLPPNQRLEAIFLLLDDDTEATSSSAKRELPSVLKGSVTVLEDLTTPAVSDEEWEASLDRTARQINGDPEAFK